VLIQHRGDPRSAHRNSSCNDAQLIDGLTSIPLSVAMVFGTRAGAVALDGQDRVSTLAVDAI